MLRYGPTRNQVVGVQAVLADGDVIERLDGLEKDNTGYDLSGLLCGSEGTLAVVTAARLRLVPRAEHVVVALLAFATIDDALAGVGGLRQAIDGLQAVEILEQDGLDLVCAQLGLAPPFARPHGAYVLVEAAGRADPTDGWPRWSTGSPASRTPRSRPTRAPPRRCGDTAKAHAEAINQLGPPHKLDVTLPADQLPEFFARVRPCVAAVAPDARVWLFGHAGDGNVHVNVTGVAPDDERVTDAVLRLVAELHGSISAEHGIGTAKRRWVHLTRSPAELGAFRAIKDALDPNGILNPHVLFPVSAEPRSAAERAPVGGRCSADRALEVDAEVRGAPEPAHLRDAVDRHVGALEHASRVLDALLRQPARRRRAGGARGTGA